MRRPFRFPLTVALLCACLFPFLVTTAPACQIPVFRYALERWPAENYLITVTPRDVPTEEGQALVKALSETPANLTVQMAPPTGAPPTLTASYPQKNSPRDRQTHSNMGPDDTRRTPAFWSGPLTAESVRSLVDSPVRREMVRRILKGDSAVWLLLESGDAAANATAAKLLEACLAQQSAEIHLPEPSPGDPAMSSPLPSAVKFSVLRIPFHDPVERAFVAMLCGSEADAAKLKEPTAFAVFGRGRAMPGLAGKDLTPESIASVSTFLCGACSCQVKEMNPGMDLLVLANWDGAIGQTEVKDPPLPPLIGLAAFATPSPAAVASPSPTPAATPIPAPAHHSLKRNIALSLLLLALLAVAGTLFLRRHQP